MPMPGEVDGALAGPGLPGPTLSLTRHTSLVAIGVVAAPSVRASPFLKDFTRSTVVLASGLKAVFVVSSQVSAVGTAAGAGAGAGAGASLPPPHATGSTHDAARDSTRATRARASPCEEGSEAMEQSPGLWRSPAASALVVLVR